MKRNYWFVVIIMFVLTGLLSCKHNPFSSSLFKSGPDSDYVGKRYVISKPFKFPDLPVGPEDSMTFEGVELGRRLFYDKHLSLDGNKSCSSCHHLQMALSDSGNAKSANETGFTTRNAPALQNLVWNNYYFWDGRSKTLAEQAKDAFHNELGLVVTKAVEYLKTDSTDVSLFKKAFGRQGDITDENIYKAIEQFVMTCISANSKYDRVRHGEEHFTDNEALGFQVFNTFSGGCFMCHNSHGGTTLLLTDNKFHNNGLDSTVSITQFTDGGKGAITKKPLEYGIFKTPSLRNVALTGPYMHDGRYKTLMQVINFYSDSIRRSTSLDPIVLDLLHREGSLHLTMKEKLALQDFLLTLTDTSFLHNPNLKDPFNHGKDEFQPNQPK